MSEVLSQHGVVVQAIQNMITSGQLAPGDRLPVEADLAESLGVSRGSLREGVRALVAMGVLETRQGSGTTVTDLSPELLLQPLVFWASLQAGPDALHVQTVRRALEVEAAGLAALRQTGELSGALRQILTDAADLIARHDHQGAMRCDLDFHRTIAQATGNPILAALIDTLAQPTMRIRMWRSIHQQGRLEAAHHEHQAVAAAIASGDAVSARATMQSHLFQATLHMDGAEPND